MKPAMRLLLAVAGAVMAALLVGALALSMSSASKRAYDTAVASQGKTVDVWVAAQDIPANNSLQDGMFIARKWPAVLVPADAVLDKAKLINVKVAQPIFAGEPIVKRRLANDGKRVGLPIPDGLVAASVPTNNVLAVGGDVYPGSHVQVVVGKSAEPLADDLLVLSTSAAVSTGETSGELTWVTLAIPPDKVGTILGAADTGTLHLVLLNKDKKGS